MGTPWIKDGKLWLNADGEVTICDTCPCSTCYDHCIDAIRERQLATGRTQWPYRPNPTKTLPQCKSEVNAMAPQFIAGTWTGGSTALPAMRSASYANLAADFCALETLIRALITTKLPFGTSGNRYCWANGIYYLGAVSGSSDTWANVKASADASLGWQTNGQNRGFAQKVLQSTGGLKYATTSSCMIQAHFGIPTNQIVHAGRVYYRCGRYTSTKPFNKLGFPIGDDGIWTYGSGKTAGLWLTGDTDVFPSAAGTNGTPWPADPGSETVNSWGWACYFEAGGNPRDLFGLIDWSFAFV